MVQEIARTTSPGAGLPDFVRVRMEDLGLRPSLNLLASIAGVNKMTLQQNLAGTNEMKLSTAEKVSQALKMSLDDFAASINRIQQH